jgi:ferritin-like protein
MKTQVRLHRKVSEYAVAEDKGVWLLTQMREFVPNDAAEFLETQIVDEKKHARLFAQRVKELNIKEPFFLESLADLYIFAQTCVDDKSWLKCMVTQSVIEELALASFSIFRQQADERTREILDEILEDEKRHLDFTLVEIGKYSKTEQEKKEISDTQAQILGICLNALKAENLNREVSKKDQADFKRGLKQAYLLHRKRFKGLNLDVPSIPKTVLAYS